MTTSERPQQIRTDHAEEVADRLLLLSHSLWTHFGRNTVDDTPAADLTLRQLTILTWLIRNNGSRITDIARAFRFSKPTASIAIARLLRVGLVTKVPDDTDHREIQISITEAGRRVQQYAALNRQRKLVDELARLSEDDRRDIGRAVPALEALVGRQDI